jgi:hypothetical protein
MHPIMGSTCLGLSQTSVECVALMSPGTLHRLPPSLALLPFLQKFLASHASRYQRWFLYLPYPRAIDHFRILIQDEPWASKGSIRVPTARPHWLFDSDRPIQTANHRIPAPWIREAWVKHFLRTLAPHLENRLWHALSLLLEQGAPEKGSEGELFLYHLSKEFHHEKVDLFHRISDLQNVSAQASFHLTMLENRFPWIKLLPLLYEQWASFLEDMGCREARTVARESLINEPIHWPQDSLVIVAGFAYADPPLRYFLSTVLEHGGHVCLVSSDTLGGSHPTACSEDLHQALLKTQAQQENHVCCRFSWTQTFLDTYPLPKKMPFISQKPTEIHLNHAIDSVASKVSHETLDSLLLHQNQIKKTSLEGASTSSTKQEITTDGFGRDMHASLSNAEIFGVSSTEIFTETKNTPDHPLKEHHSSLGHEEESRNQSMVVPLRENAQSRRQLSADNVLFSDMSFELHQAHTLQEEVAWIVGKVQAWGDRIIHIVTHDSFLALSLAHGLEVAGLSVLSTVGTPWIHTEHGRLIYLWFQAARHHWNGMSLSDLWEHPLFLAWIAKEKRTFLYDYWFQNIFLPWGNQSLKGALHHLPSSLREKRLMQRFLQYTSFWHSNASRSLQAWTQALKPWIPHPPHWLEALWSKLIQSSLTHPTLSMTQYADLLESLLRSQTVYLEKPTRPIPAIRILGPLEARWLDADGTILAGMNDGVWPPAYTSAFPEIEEALGFPNRETHLSWSAYDVLCLLRSQKIAVTRSLTHQGKSTAPSSLWYRLHMMLRMHQS